MSISNLTSLGEYDIVCRSVSCQNLLYYNKITNGTGPLSPKKYEYIISGNSIVNQSSIILNFTLPNLQINQTILCIINTTFYNNITNISSYVEQVRIFRFNPHIPLITLDYTSRELISRPNGTIYYSQVSADFSNLSLNVSILPNSSESTDYISDITFLVRS